MEASFSAVALMHEINQRGRREFEGQQIVLSRIDEAVTAWDRLTALLHAVRRLLQWLAMPRPRFYPANA